GVFLPYSSGYATRALSSGDCVRDLHRDLAKFIVDLIGRRALLCRCDDLDIAGIRNSSPDFSLRAEERGWETTAFHHARRSPRLSERRETVGHAAGNQHPVGNYFLSRVCVPFWKR